MPKSTLAEANEKRDWRIFGDFARVLIAQATRLYADEPFGADLQGVAYALDSTTIDLCLALFPWAKFRRAKGAVKMHTLLDLRAGKLPGPCHHYSGQDPRRQRPRRSALRSGRLHVMDRGYVDFGRRYRIHRSGAFFVTRAKRNFRCRRR